MLYLKINENFGFDLYGQVSGSLFYIVVIIFLVSVVAFIVSKECNVLGVVGMIVCFAGVLYMFLNPDTFLYVGGIVVGLFMDLLDNLNSGGVV